MMKRLLLALTLMLFALPIAAYAYGGADKLEFSPAMMATEAAPSIEIEWVAGETLFRKAPGNPVPTTPTNGIIAILIGRTRQFTDGTSNTLMGK
jgi:hypothetical protein